MGWRARVMMVMVMEMVKKMRQTKGFDQTHSTK